MNKFGNKKTRCLLRHLHDSKFEANYCNRLLAMKQRGEIKGFDIQKSFPFVVNNHHICSHIVDFVILHNHYVEGAVFKKGDIEAHEAKGCRTDVWIIKRKLFRALYPDIEYITISKKEPSWTKKKRRLPKAIRAALKLRSSK